MALGLLSVLRRQDGQGTVEFAVMFPVVLIVAVIAVNALLFFSECSAFDRQARQATRVYVASPAYGQDVAQSLALVKANLEDRFDEDNLSVDVVAMGVSGEFVRVVATLEFSPTLFGMGLRDEVLGVPLPKLKHSVDLSVDVYKPGVLL